METSNKNTTNRIKIFPQIDQSSFDPSQNSVFERNNDIKSDYNRENIFSDTLYLANTKQYEILSIDDKIYIITHGVQIPFEKSVNIIF